MGKAFHCFTLNKNKGLRGNAFELINQVVHHNEITIASGTQCSEAIWKLN